MDHGEERGRKAARRPLVVLEARPDILSVVVRAGLAEANQGLWPGF